MTDLVMYILSVMQQTDPVNVRAEYNWSIWLKKKYIYFLSKGILIFIFNKIIYFIF